MASTLHPPHPPPPPSASSLHPSTHFTLSPLIDPLPFHLHPLHPQHLSPLPPTPLWWRPSTHRSRQALVTHPPREQTAAAAAAAAIIPVSTRPSLKPRKKTSRDTCAAGAPPVRGFICEKDPKLGRSLWLDDGERARSDPPGLTERRHQQQQQRMETRREGGGMTTMMMRRMMMMI